MKYLMACGHVSNATQNGEPVCVLCVGRHSGATVAVRECEGTMGLEGRVARCWDCYHETESRWELPFFESRPEHEHDRYYCGCRSWD
jgi:hypothetical protein